MPVKKYWCMFANRVHSFGYFLSTILAAQNAFQASVNKNAIGGFAFQTFHQLTYLVRVKYVLCTYSPLYCHVLHFKVLKCK